MGYEEALLSILLALALSLSVGRLLEEFFIRIGFPPVLGDLLAGLMIGASFLNVYPSGDAVEGFAWFGVTLLLFYAGLETRYGEFMKSARRAWLITLGEAAAAFSLGYVTGMAFGYPPTYSVFLGAILEATSVSITVRTLIDMGRLRSVEGYTILGVAVLDDISALITIAAATSFVVLHRLDVVTVVQAAGGALIFWIATVYIFHKFSNTITRYSRKLHVNEPILGVLLAIFAVVATFSHNFGISPLIAAYAIGLAFSEARGMAAVVDRVKSIAIIFSTVFFVNSAARLDIGAAIKPEYLTFYLAIIGAAFTGKILGAGITSYAIGFPGFSALRIAVGLYPRAEFCIIAAYTGVTLGVLDNKAYLAAVLVTLVTNLATPPLLKLVFTRGPQSVIVKDRLGALKKLILGRREYAVGTSRH